MNCQDSKGNTPLHLACECNNTGMVDFLMKSGARTVVENKSGQLPGDLASRPVIKDILGWKPGYRRRSSHSSTSTSNEGRAGESSGTKGADPFRKPKVLENKFLKRVQLGGQAADSPESFQDRMKRLTREKRLNAKKIVLKKEDEGGKRAGKANWNKRFLQRYGLVSKNLFVG